MVWSFYVAFAAAGAALGGCCPLAESYPLQPNTQQNTGFNTRHIKTNVVQILSQKSPCLFFIQHMKSASGIKHHVIFTIFLACSSQSGVWCVMSNTGMEHCCPSANLAVQLAKSCCERFKRMSTENNEGKNTDPKGSMQTPTTRYTAKHAGSKPH